MTGHNSIKMKDLAQLYAKLGFKNVETYIQSGNVVFDVSSEKSEREISDMITGSIKSIYGYDVPAIIRNGSELQRVLSVNPFIEEINFDTSKIAVIFLKEMVTNDQTSIMKDINYPPDKFVISGSEIYIFCPNGFGRSKLYTNFFESKMKVTGTARNIKTIMALLALADKR